MDEPKLPKNETAESCALAEASNQACTQYNEALANYTKVMGPLLKWQGDNAASIEALELAIREYNRQFATNKSDVDLALNIYTTDEAKLGPTSKKGAPDGALYVKDASGNFHFVTEEVDVITTDFVVYEDKTLASDPARMVAGQNLVIHGDTLINDKSQMNAGAGFLVIGDTVIQTPDNGLYGEKTKVTENGRFTRYTVRSSAGGRRHKRVPNGGGSFTQSFAPLATYGLPILNATINKTPSAITFDQSALTSGDVETVLAALKANQSALSLDAKQQLSKLLAAKEQGQAVDEAILPELTKVLSQSVNTKPASVISADFSQLTIPSSALYIINADDPNLPLVQTDPAFTDYKQWLSSDYMLKALQSDPNHIHKRLSDGYGEQERIKDQYYLLTGRHINTDYHSNEEAFKQLMDNGITAAKQFGYTLGTALTPDQMANLTTDIVWLVKQPITVVTKDKDGNIITKTQDALVPKLYLRSANIATGALTPDGRYAAMSGKNMDLQLTGNLDSNGNVIAKGTMSIKANNVTNDGGIYGNFVAVTADNTIANHGTMYANSAMSLDAGNQIINQSQTTTHHNKQGQSASSNTAITRIATIRVGDGLKDQTDEQGNPLITLSLRGNQIIYQGATSDNAGGSTHMTAENGIDIGTVTTSNHISAVADDNNYFKYSQTEDVGSNITSHGNTIIRTTGEYADINIQGSSVQSGGMTAVVATGDVSISEGRQTERAESASLYTNRRLTGSKTEQSGFGQYSDKSLVSQVGGNQVVIQGVNTSLISTEVLADKDILIKADNQLLIGSAKDNVSGHSSHEVTKKGLFATSPTSVTLGKQQTRQNDAYEQTTYTGSLVGTTGGNIRLEAGDDINIINSDIIAQKDETDANTGNILFKAQAVDITSQNIQSSNESHFLQKTTGVTASVSSSVVGEVQSLETLKESINDTNSRRAKLMGSLAAVSKARTLTQNLQDGKLGNIRAQATIGSQSTKSDSHSRQEMNDAANVYAEGNLIFDVSGKGADSTVAIIGSNISVGKDLYNLVEGDVTYQASTQTNTTNSQNSSKGWGAGIYTSTQIGSGQSNQGFTINANKAKGSSQEIATTHTNTQVTVGGTTVNDIGGSLILDGANLDTTYLTGTVGGDLIVKSRQDTHQYTHNQKQAGFSADVGFNGKPQSISINGGKTDIDASYKQVTHQSGITAKESTLIVQGQGSFTGGYLITDAGKNQTQFAQGIQTQGIQNQLSYEGDAISVGIGIGADTSNPNGKAKPALQGLGYGKITPTHKTSTTHSAITDQAGLSHINTENFNQPEVQNQLNQIITNEFNKEQALKELGAQTVITTEFGREAPKQIGDYAQDKELKLLAQGNTQEAKKWAEGGVYRVALHTVVGALGTGTIEGAVTTGSVAAAAPTINKLSEQITEQLVKAGISEDTAQNATSLITSLAVATATQSAGVDTSSTATAVNVDAFNRQLHPDEIRFILNEDRVKRFADKYGLSIEEAKKELAIVVTAYHDLEWAEAFEKDGNKLNVLHGDQDRAFDFLYYDEVVQDYWRVPNETNSGMKLFKDDLRDKVREDSFKNLDELMRAAAHDQTVREYIELIWVNKDPALAAYEYNKGVGNAYNTANTNPIKTTKLILDDFINLIPNIIKSAQSSDIGPIDSVRGVADYERLLQLQGNYYDYGYLKTSQEIENSQKIWMTMPVAEVSALAAKKVLQGRNIRHTNKPASTQENSVRIENNVNADNDSFTHISDLMKKAESTGWKSPDGSIIWPPNNGIVPHSSFNTTIPVGSRLDRYGGTGDRSSYLAPVDVPVDARALSPDTNLLIRDEYIVLKPLPVIQSKVMPWFGKEGMGIQYETKEATGFTIKQLEELKYIEKVVK
ncbi:hemagglutinin repeat-containing protein [Moraxella ovis]|uniref:hemagglutinin repeat-containing protein n=1 Tax=Moraxella ovis TaxID=29433 RepID=UPI000D82992D|nr:hemagglutinin repeat-containing protein [Moraxella ovis]SPX84324.1 p120 [Moraxella ovis]